VSSLIVLFVPRSVGGPFMALTVAGWWLASSGQRTEVYGWVREGSLARRRGHMCSSLLSDHAHLLTFAVHVPRAGAQKGILGPRCVRDVSATNGFSRLAR